MDIPTGFLWHMEHALLCNNLSALAIPVVWIVGLIPHTFSLLLVTVYGAAVTNVMPRTNFDANRLVHVPKHIQIIAFKCQGAHRNGLECFPLFVGAVLTMNLSSLAIYKQNIYALLYVLIRILFNILYVSISSERLSVIRSLVWNTGNMLAFIMIFESVVSKIEVL
ncbi:hypothetical protein V1511DRAFT_506895 [Dipodascopsis uninucleata]